MSEPEDTIMLNGKKYWVKRAYRPQPPSDHMLPECENPPQPASYQTVFRHYSRRGPEKQAVKMVYDIMARGR